MSPCRPRTRRLAPPLAVLLLAAGCSLLRAPDPPRTRFYVLDPIVQPASAPSGKKLFLGLGPLHVPPYLERPEMVRRVSENQLVFDEFDRWGEPLKSNIMRVLATNLDRLIAVERMTFYPWYSTTPIDYAIEVSIMRFEPQPDGQLLLDARWIISDRGGTPVRNADVTYRAPAGTPAETAAAMSSLCGDLSRDLANALRALRP